MLFIDISGLAYFLVWTESRDGWGRERNVPKYMVAIKQLPNEQTKIKVSAKPSFFPSIHIAFPLVQDPRTQSLPAAGWEPLLPFLKEQLWR